jgi:hypothetical protein
MSFSEAFGPNVLRRQTRQSGVLLMVLCGMLVVGGIAATARWGGLSFQCLDPAAPVTAAQRYFWNVTLAVTAGVGAGLLVAGAGGRLVMRLLAVTAGAQAQGQLTEAEEVVGRISTGGTVGFVVFTALFFGLVTGIVYMIIRRWLPTGRLGGLAYGALLLVLVGSRIEPLRADNPDFDLVGPSWVAVAAFGALVVTHGMLVAALAARYSRRLAPFSAGSRAWLGYAPLLALVPILPVLAIVAAGGVVAVLIGKTAGPRREPGPRMSRRALIGGRAVLCGGALVALPGFVSAVTDIAGRGP